RHLPVADFAAESTALAEGWDAVSGEARAVLAAGGRVLIHCMGGCGRSGMAALRLMVEAGEAPEAAMVRLRRARPCAVETGDQYDWAAR
ncbi:MAG: protein-tyrosine phosphatase family protein, partial [Albidovulum sp.]